MPFMRDILLVHRSGDFPLHPGHGIALRLHLHHLPGGCRLRGGRQSDAVPFKVMGVILGFTDVRTVTLLGPIMILLQEELGFRPLTKERMIR